MSVAQVARRHGLNANLIFKWLKDPRFAPADAVEPVATELDLLGARLERLAQLLLERVGAHAGPPVSPSRSRSAASPRDAWRLTDPALTPIAAAICASLRSA